MYAKKESSLGNKKPEPSSLKDINSNTQGIHTFRSLGVWRKLYLIHGFVLGLFFLLGPIFAIIEEGLGVTFLWVFFFCALGIAYVIWVYKSVVSRKQSDLLALIIINAVALNLVNALFLLLIRISSKRELENPQLVKSKEKAQQKREVPRNCSLSDERSLKKKEHIDSRFREAPYLKSRMKWILGCLLLLLFATFTIIYLNHRNSINKKLSPLLLATDLKPNDPYAWTSLAGGAYRLNRYSIAEDAAKRAVQLGHRGNGGYLWLGRVYREQGNYEEAVYCYQRAASFHAKTDLGDLYHKMGEYQKSKEQYLRAVKILLVESRKEEAGWWIWDNLGDVYLKIGEEKKAHAAYGTALSLGEDLDWIREKMELIAY